MRLRTAETLSLAARFYRRYLWSWDVTAGFLASLLFTSLVASLLGRYAWWPKRMRSGGQ